MGWADLAMDMLLLLGGAVSAANAAGPYPLWDGPLPPAETEVAVVAGVQYVDIKQREPEVDGYDWLHGVALAFHEGVLFTSWGNNKGTENTPTEVTRGRRSPDGGKAWLPVEMIAPGAPGEGNSHGAFLPRGDELWALLPRFGKGAGTHFPGLCMEAYLLNAAGQWEPKGVVGQAIWPLEEPVRTARGDWIVAGCDENWKAAVAISHGEDLLHWDTVKLPVGERVYTEATTWVSGDDVVLVMRNESPDNPDLPCAVVSVSHDGGHSWGPCRESNFPMVTSKPYAGTLSNGQRYLVASVCRSHPRSRRTLAIAVSRPGQEQLCRMWQVETTDGALSYPYAVEHDGHLWVAYSSAPRGLGGNRNNARMAIIPLASLAVD
jgi:hypothetical protein